MNANLKKSIRSAVEKHGFFCKKDVFIRIRNDVVQGFRLKGRKQNTLRCLSLSYSVYPLCNPYSNYHRLSFERREIGMLMPSFSLWPFSYEKDSAESYERCAAEIIRSIQKYLLPYFDLYDTCAKASCGISELSGHHGAVLDAVYFALKAQKTETALDGLRAILRQREAARKENRAALPPELCTKAEDRSRQEDAVIESVAAFVQAASEEEMQRYLLENERSGIRDLLAF